MKDFSVKMKSDNSVEFCFGDKLTIVQDNIKLEDLLDMAETITDVVRQSIKKK